MNISAAMKVILLTGATDGIGKETAKKLIAQGHQVLLHGRSAKKLESLRESCTSNAECQNVETFQSDLSDPRQVVVMANSILEKHDRIDVLINNAGVFKVPQSKTADGLDVRFAVNTIAPYLLTKKLLPILPKHARVINVSSAAQAPVDLEAVKPGGPPLSDNAAYAQSKLGVTMMTYALSLQHTDHVMVSVNPASFLGSKMVKEAYGVAGKSLDIGADILVEAATSKKFDRSSGKYWDNDNGAFLPPHPDGTNQKKSQALADTMDSVLRDLGIH